MHYTETINKITNNYKFAFENQKWISIEMTAEIHKLTTTCMRIFVLVKSE